MKSRAVSWMWFLVTSALIAMNAAFWWSRALGVPVHDWSAVVGYVVGFAIVSSIYNVGVHEIKAKDAAIAENNEYRDALFKVFVTACKNVEVTPKESKSDDAADPSASSTGNTSTRV